MNKESMQVVHASGEKKKWRDKLSPANKSRAATGFVWWNHGQSVIGGAAAIGLAATGAFVPAAVAAGFVGFNEMVEVPVAQKYRNNRRAEIGKPPKKQRKVLGMIDISKRGKGGGAHQLHQETSHVHQLPQRGTIFQKAA